MQQQFDISKKNLFITKVKMKSSYSSFHTLPNIFLCVISMFFPMAVLVHFVSKTYSCSVIFEKSKCTGQNIVMASVYLFHFLAVSVLNETIGTRVATGPLKYRLSHN